MIILGIDTSCDETAAAVCENDRILSNIISSQVKSHAEWGGVVPGLARRKHEELIDHIVEIALKRSGKTMESIDAIAVTKGPGLAVALEVGIKKAKELAIEYKKPLIPINHMEGHIYSALAKNSKGKPTIEYKLPLLVLLISGGHTELVLMRNNGQYEILGQTLDDAIGESFDKVGRILNMGYPAGPVLEKIAENGDENSYELPIPMKNSKDLNMSYSGLKTASMKLVNDEIGAMNDYGAKFVASLQTSQTLSRSQKQKDLKSNKNPATLIANISASFQKAAVEQVLFKTNQALRKLENDGLQIQDLIIAGGVAQNKYLRKKFRKTFPKLRIHYPLNKKLFTDNAGMIAIAGYFNALRGNVITDVHEINRLDREPNWGIDSV